MTDAPETSKVSWVYLLKKDELIAELTNREQSTEGNFSELRARLVAIIKAPTQKGQNPEEIEENQMEDRQRKMEIVRKWGLHFDGSRDPIEFIERLKELQTAYGLQDTHVLQALPETLNGKALLWYRNNNKYWNELKDFEQDFRNFFVSSVLTQSLEAQIRNRLQRNNEGVKDYIIDIQTMIRRHGEFNHQEELNRIYTNMNPKYKLYIKRQDVSSTQDIIRLAEEYDMVQKEIYNRNNTRCDWTQANSRNNKIQNFDRQTCCWRCGRRGHNRRNCRAIAVLFCSHCGTRGTTSNNCQCRSRPENSNRTGQEGGNPVSI